MNQKYSSSQLDPILFVDNMPLMTKEKKYIDKEISQQKTVTLL